MLIVLYLIFTSAFINSKAVKETYREQFEFIDNILSFKENVSKTTPKNGTTATTPNFKMLLDDLNKKKNLKLNFFDNMLTNEMLSIKKHLQEKDSTLITHLNISTNMPHSTPTLEIKQKWPTIKNIYTPTSKDKKQSTKYYNITSPTSKINFSSTNIDFNDLANGTKRVKVLRRNKVVGVRSFTDHEYLQSYTQHDPKKCMCVDVKTTCTTQFSASTKCEKCRTRSFIPVCTRTTIPYTVYPYIITYVTPYINIPTEPPKKHKHKRPHSHSPKHKYRDYYEYYKIYDENINHNSEDKQEVEDYEGEINESKEQTKEESFEANREKLVSNIVDDLKVYYSDAVIKDCYCSSWSNIFQTKCFTFYIAIFLMFFV